MTIDLYPHNQRAYDLVKEEWKSNNRACVVQPTGTGKSFVIMRCIQDFHNAIIITPREYIINHLQEKLNQYELETTIMTYCKLMRLTQDHIEEINPDLIVLDEFHHCGAECWGNGVQRLLSAYPNAKILGTSATEIRYLDNQRDMSDELFSGNVAFRLSLAEAMAQRILPTFKYVSALYTFDFEINRLRGEVEDSNNNENEKKDLILQVDKLKDHLEKSKNVPSILKQYLLGNFVGKYIVFCKNKKHLLTMKEVVKEWFIAAGTIDSDIRVYSTYTGYSQSDAEFNKFKSLPDNKLRLLFAIEKLNEGVHLKDISGVILLRPTQSPTLYFQQIGRCTSVDKSDSPWIFDLVNNFMEIQKGQSAAFNLKKEFDDAVKKCKKDALAKNEKYEPPEFLVFNEFHNEIEFFKDIESKLLDSWHLQFQKLCEFKEQYGHCRVKKEYDKTVYNWVNTQRTLSNRGQLREDRKEKLDSIGFYWDWPDEQFENGYQHTLKYYESNGNIDIPINYIDEDGYQTGEWLCRQRQRCKNKKLSTARIKRLNDLGISWNPLDEEFQNALNHVKEYYIEHGDLNVPQNYKSPDGFCLGEFVIRQRQKYKKHKLTQEKIDILNQYGMIWNRDLYDCATFIKHYIEYKKTHGEPAQRVVTDDSYNLGMACSSIRYSYRRGTLPRWKIDMLNKAGFSWESPHGRNGKSNPLKQLTHTSQRKAEYQTLAL